MAEDTNAAVRADYDARAKEVRERTAQAEARMAEYPPTPTQEEADLAKLGLVPESGFAASAPASRTTAVRTPPPRNEPLQRTDLAGKRD